jgi:Mg2+-importing ATPase
MGIKNDFDYRTSPMDEVLNELQTSISGLSSLESKKRLEEQGPNVLAEKKEFNIVLEFLSHFKNPLIIILLVAAGLSWIMDKGTDAIIIGCMILFGVILDFAQEYNADKALKKLLESVKTTATVIRDGERQEISISELVVGDIIFLCSGDLIPADARIVKAKDFFVNQSAITGESFPSEKTSAVPPPDRVSLSESSNIIFKGTNVVSGSATAVIIKTGKNTEFGKIASNLARAPVKSDFEKGIDSFGFFLMKVILALVIFIFFVNSFLKHDFFQSFMFAIAIAVGITPELLPMIMAITMTAGSKKMLKKGVIVKVLSSIPNFGSMNILCADKTGTLTENKINLVQYSDYKGVENEDVLLYAYLNSSFQTGIKNPLDDAVIAYKKKDITAFYKVDEIPYDFFRKRMSVIANNGKNNFLISKGAPEEIIKCCASIKISSETVTLDKKTEEEAINTYHKLSMQGFRVLGVAAKQVKQKQVYSKDEEINMTFEGFVSFLDPPKKDVKEVLNQLRSIGVETKIITGDNELVTRKICDEVGLEIKGILLGADLDKFTDDALKIKAQNTTIFARCSPDEKNRIITALKSNRNVVGYMGDGINDAPSLKTADVGISVDSAVDIAKESADIVLTKKSLKDLEEGIIEGRKTFANTMKYVMMALSSNFGNMFSAAGAVLFLPFLPMLPIQIILNNFIYDFSQVTIPFDNVDDDEVQKPKKWNMDSVIKFMYVFGPISSIFDFATFFLLFFVIKAPAAVFQTGWFLESLATQIIIIHVIRTKKTPIFKSRASKWLVASSFLCLAFGWILPYTPLGPLFKFEPLPLYIVLMLAGIVLAYLITVEMAKRIFYRK